VVDWLTATDSIFGILLSWEDAKYAGHSYTEIWRADTDNLGVATKIDVSLVSTYVDDPPFSTPYYYWVRRVSLDNVAGPYNKIGGTVGIAAPPGGLLPTPTDLVGFYSVEPDGRVSRIKVRMSADISSIVPSGAAVMVSVQQVPREVEIVDHGTYFTISSVETLSSGSLTIMAGSTDRKVVIATPSNPLPDIDLSGFYWGAIDGAGFRKAISSDSTAVYFASPFDNAPVVGNPFSWVEVAWADERSGRFRLLYVLDSAGNAEVVEWGGVEEVSNEYLITGLSRAKEGTTQVVGVKAQYYPAVGAGTETIIFPASAFVQVSPGIWEMSTDVTVDVPPGSWVATTIATYAADGAQTVRSNIVPITDWRPL